MEKIILSSLSLDDLATRVAETVISLQQNIHHQKEEPRESEFLTILQAAELLNLAKPTIYGLTHKGEIPFIKKGKKLYFRKSDLIEWLNMGRRLTKAERRKEAENSLLHKRKRFNGSTQKNG